MSSSSLLPHAAAYINSMLIAQSGMADIHGCLGSDLQQLYTLGHLVASVAPLTKSQAGLVIMKACHMIGMFTYDNTIG